MCAAHGVFFHTSSRLEYTEIDKYPGRKTAQDHCGTCLEPEPPCVGCKKLQKGWVLDISVPFPISFPWKTNLFSSLPEPKLYCALQIRRLLQLCPLSLSLSLSLSLTAREALPGEALPRKSSLSRRSRTR
jgi:hypothetical protein